MNKCVAVIAALLFLTSILGGPVAAQDTSLKRKAFEAVMQSKSSSASGQTATQRTLGAELAGEIIKRMVKDESGKKARAAAGQDTAQSAQVDEQLMATPAPTTVIVRMKDPAMQALSDQNQPLPDHVVSTLSTAVGVHLLNYRAMSGRAHVLQLGRNLTREEYEALVRALAGHFLVEAAAPNEWAQAQYVPDDPFFFLQWSMFKRTGPFFGIDAVSAWDITVGSSSIVVAVVDSGVLPHPDFAWRLLPGYDFVSDPANSNDGNGRDADASDPGDFRAFGKCPGSPASNSSWHGTHVTGTIAADGDDGYGVAGLNWRSKILPVRALGTCGGSRSDIIDAMRWAAGLQVPGIPKNQKPARVVNMSLGGRGRCDLGIMQPAINEVLATGAIIVVAAGNDDSDAGNYTPASCKGVITVGATDWDGDKASYSNWSGIKVTIAAPGGDINRDGNVGGILSTVSTGLTGPGPADWFFKQGTSMAAPHVSGVASLMLSVNPDLSPAEALYVMQAMAEPFPSWSVCATQEICGAGIVSASGSVAAAFLLKPFNIVYEFGNYLTNHYFRTGRALESDFINLGFAGPGWYDTLDYFIAFREPNAQTKPVCRFYSADFNSHFYTINQAECEWVKQDKHWRYEEIVFHAIPASGGSCPADTSPVYRVYNNRFAQMDVNHRFTTSIDVYQEMQRQGWLPEGIAFCTPG